MSLLEQETFIKGIPPFDKLNFQILNRVVENLDIAYFGKDETILSSGAMPEFLYFIIKGGVQERDEEEVVSLFSHHDFFDPISLIENHSKHDFVTVEESICYQLPREIFMEILDENGAFEQYFFQSISQKLSASAEHEQTKELTNFMIARVKDAYIQKPLIVDETRSIYDAVQKMKSAKVSSLLVDNKGELGIVTDADFREKFVLKRLSADDSILELSSFGLVEINENEFLFNAQLKMTKYSVKRLVVRDNEGNLVGVLDYISLLSFFSSHFYAIFNEIEVANDIKSLKEASEKLIRVIKTLFAKGVKVRYIAKLISQLNGKIFQKLFILTAPNELKENSVLIVMGSEGREEQILKTDQDNALILSNDCKIDEKELIAFTKEFTETLIRFGYPKCPGKIMISNPEWVMTELKFKEKISEWIEIKDSDAFMQFAIVYDAIAVAGNSKLLESVKLYIYKKVETSSAFFTHFAKASVSFETPLGLFTNFIVEARGLDIKKGGLFSIVHGVRSLSLEHNIIETNTIIRLKKLNDKGVIDRTLTSDLIESFNFFLTLRLKSNISHIERGEEISNFLNPKQLSKIEKDLLKDALKIVDEFKKFITFHYKLNLIG